MPTLTVTASATVTKDGSLVQIGASNFQADVRWFNQITKDLTNSYSIVVGGGGFVFALIENKGNDTIITRMITSGSDFIRFAIPPGGHAFIPGRTAVDGSSFVSANGIAMRSRTSAGSRVVVHIGGGSTSV